ncbi:MAG TPA: hypothetical protein VM509_10915 [Planctomycetota bacterium]|nr:hypothetical protein [Planctomycetota bacterium]
MKSLYLFLLTPFLLAGCASTYYDAHFVPQTAEAITTDPDGGQARSVVSYVGVRRKDRKTGAPPQVEFKMRVENLGKGACTLEQHALQLLSGSLEPFGAAQLAGNDPPVIVAGASANYDVLFPLPQGRSVSDVDLRSLNLRWAIRFDGQEYINAVTFERAVPVPYDSSHFSVGIGIWGR